MVHCKDSDQFQTSRSSRHRWGGWGKTYAVIFREETIYVHRYHSLNSLQARSFMFCCIACTSSPTYISFKLSSAHIAFDPRFSFTITSHHPRRRPPGLRHIYSFCKFYHFKYPRMLFPFLSLMDGWQEGKVFPPLPNPSPSPLWMGFSCPSENGI